MAERPVRAWLVVAAVLAVWFTVGLITALVIGRFFRFEVVQ